MKRLTVLGFVLCAVVAWAGYSVAKGPGGNMGAEKVALMPRTGATGEGWAVLVTDDEGIVKANVHLDGAPADEEYAIFIVIGTNWQGVDGTIATNWKGRGAGLASQMIPENQIGEDGTIAVRLAVRPDPVDPSMMGWSSGTVVLPVKPPCDH